MTRPGKRDGYSLIEVLIGLLVIGILAGVAAHQTLDVSDSAAIEATVQQLKTIVLAVEMHRHEVGDWPPSAAPGQMPAGLEAYLRPDLFASACPIGGHYDWDGSDSGAARLKIVGAAADGGAFAKLDAHFDDGALDTGRMTSSTAWGADRVRIAMD